MFRFPALVCSVEDTFIGAGRLGLNAGRLELNKEIRKQLRL